MRRHTAAVALASLLVAAVTASSGAKTVGTRQTVGPGAPFAAVRDRVRALVADGKSPSMAIAVAHDGRIVYEEGFGMADRERAIPATPDTVYFLASVAKSITATAVMILVERGRVRLDAPASTYLDPGLLPVRVGDPNALTVRTLLNMTAGVPHLYAFEWADEHEAPPSEAEVLRKYAFSAFEPGRHFHYSNLSFGVLERIVERVSGRTFGRFCDEEIFRPLRMRRTALTPGGEVAAHLARVYAADVDGPLPWHSMRPEGGAGFYSSAHDLALFGLAMTRTPAAGRRVVSSDSVARMLDASGTGVYGLGWWKDVAEPASGVMIADGLAWGGGATVMVAPAAGVVAVATVGGPTESNVTTFVAGDLLAAALPGYRSPRERWPAATPPPDMRSEPFRATGAWARTWRGVATTPAGDVPVTLALDGPDDVRITVAGGGPRPLENATLTGGLLEADADVRMPAAVAPGPHRVRVRLRLVEGRLAGYLVADSSGKRGRYGLPFFVELRPVDSVGREGAGQWPWGVVR